MGFVYLNGEFVPEHEAKISVFDRGFLYGDGIFETVRAYDGTVFRLQRHIERLFSSAEILSLSLPHGPEQFYNIVRETLQVNGLSNASVRLSVTRGICPVGISTANCSQPTVLCAGREIPDGQDDKQKSGVQAVIVQTRRTPTECLDSRAKTFNFLNNIMARIEADTVGAFEGIMLSPDGKLTEGTVSNVFFCHRGVLCTPSLNAGILPGIARETVLEIGISLGLQIREGIFEPGELLAAGEIFLTNSNWEVMPVVNLNGQAVGVGAPGEITAALAAGYAALVKRESSSCR